jgi:hypothetical protein
MRAFAGILYGVTIRHGDVAAFTLSLLLAASWASISVNTVRACFSPNALNASAVVLVVLLFYWVFISGVLYGREVLFSGSSAAASAS